MVEVAALVAGWMTPTSLFVLLNIVIATIFFTSSFGFGSNQNNNKQPESTTAQSHPQLFRAPSLFSRVTSFNFSSTSTPQHHHHYSSYHSEPDETHFQPRPDPNPPTPSLLSRVASFNFCRAQAQEEPDVAAEGKMGISSEEKVGDESRAVKREPEEEREKEKKKVVVKQRKAGGKKTKAAVGTAKTVSSEKSKTVSLEKKSTEGEVDAKADDFINRFKQQLKMQRLESLLRYRTPA